MRPSFAAMLAAVVFAVPAPPAWSDAARLLRQTEQGAPVERANALRALAREDAAAAVATATAWLEPGLDPVLRRAAARTLWNLGEKARGAEGTLRARVDDADADVAYAVVGALAALRVPREDLRAARLRLARSDDAFIAFYAARALHPEPALGTIGAMDAALGALAMVASGRPADSGARSDLRSDAFRFLRVVAEKGGRAGFDRLLVAYPPAPPRVKDAIAHALAGVPPADGDAGALVVLLDSADVAVRRSGLFALAAYREAALPALPRMLEALQPNREPEYRLAAATALGQMGQAPALATEQALQSAWRGAVEARIALPLARAAVDDADVEVRKEAAQALQKLALWAGPALPLVGERMALEPDPRVRHALVRACWTARESPQLPRAALQQMVERDPEAYVRNEAKSVLDYRG